MSEPLSLLEFAQRLASDGDLRGDFAADPHGVLAEHGLDGLPPQDVHDALVLVEDTRTLDYDPAHVVDPPSFDAAGPDALVHYLAGYAGLPADPGGFEVDGSGDIDDLDGYPAPAPQHVVATDDVPHVGTGFGHGVAPVDDLSDDPADDVPHHEPDAPSELHPATEPAFDEPGTYDEFGTEPAFDHSHGFDHPVDEPGHHG